MLMDEETQITEYTVATVQNNNCSAKIDCSWGYCYPPKAHGPYVVVNQYDKHILTSKNA